MKEGIHPEYYQATVTCNCGNTFVTGSTKKDIHVEICSNCDVCCFNPLQWVVAADLFCFLPGRVNVMRWGCRTN